MADITIRIEGDERLKALARDPDFIRGPLKDFLESSAGVIQREAKQRAPASSGHLKGSIYAKVVLLPGAKSFASVGPAVFYAPYVEYGTKPHWVPIAAIRAWVREKSRGASFRASFNIRGGKRRRSDIDNVAYAVQHAIAKRGTRPHPFMAPAVEASIPSISGFLEALGQAIRARWER